MTRIRPRNDVIPSRQRTVLPANAQPRPKPTKHNRSARFLKYAKTRTSTAIQRIKASSAKRVRKLARSSCDELQAAAPPGSGTKRGCPRRLDQVRKNRTPARRAAATANVRVLEFI